MNMSLERGRPPPQIAVLGGRGSISEVLFKKADAIKRYMDTHQQRTTGGEEGKLNGGKSEKKTNHEDSGIWEPN